MTRENEADLESGGEQLPDEPAEDLAARELRLRRVAAEWQAEEQDAKKLQEEERQARRRADSTRATLGLAVGACSILFFVLLAIVSFVHLHQLLDQKTSGIEGARFFVFVGGQALVTMALVWFLYQLLKAAERMLLPSHYIMQVLARDPGFVRALIGVQDPAVGVKTAGQALESLTGPLGKLTESVSSLVPRGPTQK